MALKVELKPGERLIIGGSVVTNGDQRTRLFIEGDAPILREKDILTIDTADTPAKRIYLAVQLMYLGETSEELQKTYFDLSLDLVQAAPSTTMLVDGVNKEILTGNLYKALKVAKKLIDYEQELLANASASSVSVPADFEADDKPA